MPNVYNEDGACDSIFVKNTNTLEEVEDWVKQNIDKMWFIDGKFSAEKIRSLGDYDIYQIYPR